MKDRQIFWLVLVVVGFLSAVFIGMGIASQCSLCGPEGGGSPKGIYGKVTDGSGQPVSGVIVCILCQENCDSTSSISCTTDSNGDYEVHLGTDCGNSDTGTYRFWIGQCNATGNCHDHDYHDVVWNGGVQEENWTVHCH